MSTTISLNVSKEQQSVVNKEERDITDKFAVIDTETNWYDEVMSIGIVVAETETMKKLMLHITYLIQSIK